MRFSPHSSSYSKIRFEHIYTDIFLFKLYDGYDDLQHNKNDEFTSLYNYK